MARPCGAPQKAKLSAIQGPFMVRGQLALIAEVEKLPRWTTCTVSISTEKHVSVAGTEAQESYERSFQTR